jgi:hypothetical protein
MEKKLRMISHDSIEIVKEELRHGLELFEKSNNLPTRLHGAGHAQCASIILDKMGVEDAARNKRMVQIIAQCLRECGDENP